MYAERFVMFTAQQLWSSASLDMSGIMPHLAHCKMHHAGRHWHIYICSHIHEDTQIQFPLLYNVFLVHANYAFAACQLYLT